MTDTALLGLALVFRGLLLLPYLTSVQGWAATALSLANGLIWLAFATDYVVRLSWPWTGGSTSGTTCLTW